ncbi:MAG: hypothetical protein KBT09_07875 [Bacteroidales bacterium]|nr:hypothetical protein [Candidatus Sodaliphilus fimicaballi]
MIKRIIFAAVCILMCASAVAEDKPINALCLKFKEGYFPNPIVSAQFITSPEISYKDDGETLVLSGTAGSMEYPIAAIEEMTFIHSENIITEITDILNEQFPAKNKAVEGIFDLRGMKLDRITSPGIYIVNGKKVLVR